MSRDREFESSNTHAPAASSSSNLRFRNQSPSTSNRRSRERDREQMKEINSSINQSTEMGGEMDAYESTRMNEELLLGYPSLNSDDMDIEGGDPNKQQSTTSSRGHNRTNSLQAIDRLITKIACTKESIRREQTARDGKKIIFFKEDSRNL